MTSYTVAYSGMDWDKHIELKNQLFELDINCVQWTDENQASMVEVDVESQEALEILLNLGIIDQCLHNELIGEVQTLFLS
ncbi:hypothetical protein [bacterium endosymbiont of Bathymodiolus sp. 5 South]|jgi:hypothetical protein|uniref:hypothetical protein n=1 Tax=bacterium endosymbiont of Bathymodiolus sp. 5 South TaxID=1181670 RepID=UPI0010AFD300|nr:hypothetical protein [bacterium endosymbiont of Bathymodiolus sp. 5 South]CAC9450672.1 hypothetical protein [uncultured Gammaproteobacteria bacterium]CAC9653134.1 hypothetical protein [uncultured Gammaproteobacteria bacterium]CAC9657525.1 hypothetical protein [uncultured Gammaproteobacteria bacterium]SSC09319.1 hypothetical protein BTURTLESOX_2504 [bacterium endosymbiont of Bathymodiolus sp. 5 South]VVH58967.1 hypothetical protein BSPCLSOX_2793 [uncultured Gammaproteobacteria bacterium]